MNLRRLSVLFLYFLFFSYYSYGQGKDSLQVIDSSNIRFTAYPALGYSPETSLSFGGVGLFIFPFSKDDIESPFHRPSSVSPYFLYTLNKQILSAIKSEIYLSQILNLNNTLRYFNYPDYYYGIGRHSTVDGELFTDKFFRWNSNIGWATTPNIFLGLGYDWQINRLSDFEENSQLVRENIIGSDGGHILGFGPFVRVDSRNNIYYPDKGIYLEFTNLLYPDTFGNDYIFNNLRIDFRTFKSLFSEKNILAFQMYYNQASGERIPFYKLPRLGGDIRLRGIQHENVYRDKHAYYLQIEGRRELFWRLGGVIFAGLGNVASRFSEIDFRDMKYVIGMGGRFRPFKDEKLNLRLDIGKGPADQYAIYLSINEAF